MAIDKCKGSSEFVRYIGKEMCLGLGQFLFMLFLPLFYFQECPEFSTSERVQHKNQCQNKADNCYD